MSDAQQAPVIQLDIDQALFVQAVQQGDLVEDATVATEVTNLNHVDSAYVLHGAIVLAGQLQHTQSDGGAVYAADGFGAREPLELRLPFTLRVPDKSQPRGIVNVASRIANCRFAVVDDHWLHMEADLQVSGLNGKNGFAFQCGSQEFGSLIANEARQAVDEDEPQASVDASAFDEVDEPTIEFIPPILHDVEAATHQEEGRPASRELQDFDRALEGQGASMRGSVEPESAVYDPSEEDTHTQAVSSTNTEFARGHVEGVNARRTDAEEIEAASDQPVTDDSREAQDSAPEVYETFDFEHQITPDEAPVPMAVNEPQRQDLPFSAARSFQDDSFRPHVGFTGVPEVSFRAAVPEESEREEAEPLLSEENVYSTTNTTLWSFVDFNQPDTRYTLRYAVVMDDESLESLADRLGCRVSDLAAVNHLTGEEVRSGQTLRIPGSVVNLAGKSSR